MKQTMLAKEEKEQYQYAYGNNKLRTYCLIKSEYKMEGFLTSIANLPIEKCWLN